MKLNHELTYGKWKIYNDTAYKSIFIYYHDDFDGTPEDDRKGSAWTLDQAIEQINDYENELPEMLKVQAI